MNEFQQRNDEHMNKLYKQIQVLKNKLDDDPTSIDILSQLAEKYNLLGQYKNAIKICNQILKNDMKHKIAYNNLFYAYDLLDDFDNVMKVLKNYLEHFDLVKEPELIKFSYTEWAKNYYKLRRNEPRFVVSKMPLNRSSGVIDLNFSTSFHFSRIGWSVRSSEALKLILEYFPQDVNILNALGNSYISAGQFLEAKESLNKAIIINENLMTHFLLGRLYKKTGRFKDAEIEYNFILQNQDIVNLSIANYYQIQMNIKDKLRELALFISANTELGFIYNETCEYEQAIAHFSRVIEYSRNIHPLPFQKNPSLNRFYFYLGIVYLALRSKKLASRAFMKAIKYEEN